MGGSAGRKKRKRRLIDEVMTGFGPLELYKSGDIYEISADGLHLMGSNNSYSEQVFAREILSAASRPHEGSEVSLNVLIGGLGMGYTLKAALEFPGVTHVDVVEIEPRIVEWNRLYFGHLNDDALLSPLVNVVIDDIRHYVENNRKRYQAIMLDTDNGPGWLVSQSNSWLYTCEGLSTFKGRLTLGGAVAIWSAQEERWFRARMARIYEEVRGIPVRSEKRHGPPHWIYLGKKQSENERALKVTPWGIAE